MKTIVYLKYPLIALLGLSTLTSCVKDDEFDIPKVECSTQFAEPNSSIEAVKQLTPMPVAPTYESNHVIKEDLIFDGYVVSSDEGGNFYKQLTIQDDPTNPTAGIQIAINKSYLYTDYPVGAHVRINAKGLSVGEDRGVIKLGYEKPTGQIQETKMAQFITGVCGGSTMDIATITPKVVNSIEEATSEENINTLVTIKNVQFADADGKATYADAVNNITTDRTLVDKEGNTAVLRNSGYAKFAGKIMPTGSGEVTAVVTKYTSGRNVTWQLYIRDLNDVKFDQDRFVLANSILGGSNVSYPTSLNETFDNVGVSSKFNRVDDEKYINYSATANRFWEQKNFGGNNYIQLSAFKANADVKAYFMLPAEFTGSSKLAFQSKDGHDNGAVLKVYYTTKYTPGTGIVAGDLVDITNLFKISSGNTTGYGTDWVDSGEVTIPTTGKGFIIFEYTGSKEVTTTMQIDNISLK